MSFHGSRSRGQRVPGPLYPHSTTLGPSRVHAPSYGLGIGDPIPLPTCKEFRLLQYGVGVFQSSESVRQSVHIVLQQEEILCLIVNLGFLRQAYYFV